MIKVSHFDKYFNKGRKNSLHVIKDTSLTLPDKGLVTILGQSGSGKTTLLNCIAGLDRANGEISYDDTFIKKYNMKKVDDFRSLNIGYIFQNYNLIQNLTVKENLKLGLDLIGDYDYKDIDEKIDYCLNAVGLKKFKNRTAGALSGGQQQRVSIARALLKNAKIFIADEPTGNLDSENSVEVMNILKKISLKRLVLLVTHNKNLAYFYSDRIIEIKDGSVISDTINEDFKTDLSSESSKKIYLLDYKKEEINSDKIDIHFYNDGSLDEKIIFNLIIKNGNIYLDTKNKIIDTKEKNISILNEKSRQIKKEDIESFDFDLEEIPKAKKSAKKIFKNIWNELKLYFKPNKKTKLLRTCFLFIGLLAGALSVFLGIYNNQYVKKFSTPDKAYMVASDKANGIYLSRNDMLSIINKDSGIYEFGYVGETAYDNAKDIRISFQSFGQSTYNTSLYESASLSPKSVIESMVLGTNDLKDSEVIISLGLAKEFMNMNKYATSLESFIGMNLNCASLDFKIKGISSSNAVTLYFNDRIENAIAHNQNLGALTSTLYYKDTTYKVTLGRDILSSNAKNECLINEAYSTGYHIGERYMINNSDYLDIVGFYHTDEVSSKIITGFEEGVNANNYLGYTISLSRALSLNMDLEGDLPKDNGEVILSSYYKYNIGSTIKLNGDDYKVVGKVKSNALEKNLIIVTDEKKVLLSYDQNQFLNLYLYSNDILKTKELFSQFGYTLDDGISAHKVVSSKKLKLTNTFIYTLAIAIAVVEVVIIYFVMRSKMLSNIYEIGVYRALGAKRNRIYLKYLYDILFVTLFQTTLGFLISILIGHLVLNANILSIVVSSIYKEVLITYFTLLVISIIFGLLPIFNLLRKTPSEIISKYDI